MAELKFAEDSDWPRKRINAHLQVILGRWCEQMTNLPRRGSLDPPRVLGREAKPLRQFHQRGATWTSVATAGFVTVAESDELAFERGKLR
jgi:hypothetical protein